MLIMAPKSAVERKSESRKRKHDNELRASGKFFHFLRNTPFSLNTTGSEKFEAFLQLRASNVPTPVSNDEKKNVV